MKRGIELRNVSTFRYNCVFNALGKDNLVIKIEVRDNDKWRKDQCMGSINFLYSADWSKTQHILNETIQNQYVDVDIKITIKKL